MKNRHVKRATYRLGANLEGLRWERGWSQEVLSARAGISRVTISEIECCKVNPQWSTLVALAAALGVKVEDLVGEES